MQIQYFVLLHNIFSARGIFGQCSGSAQTVSVGYTSVSFTTPGYPSPGYDKNSVCAWLGTSSETGATLLFRVTNINVDCAGDAINVYDGSDNTGTLVHSNECGTTRTLSYRTTSSINVYTTFTSDNVETTPSSEQGFRLYMISGKDFSGTGCSASQSLTATNTEQFISSPNFPVEYNINTNCTWVITATDTNANVVIDVKFLNIEDETTCSYDYLEIKDSGGATIEKVCQENKDNDWNPDKSYTSTGNSITVMFFSDNQDGKNGFLLSYNQTDDSTTTTEDTTETSTTLSDSTTTTEDTTETSTTISDSTTTTEDTTETSTTISDSTTTTEGPTETSTTLSGSNSTQNATTNVDTTNDGGSDTVVIVVIVVAPGGVVSLAGGVVVLIKKKTGIFGPKNPTKVEPTTDTKEANNDSDCKTTSQSTNDNSCIKINIEYPDCIYTMPDCYKEMPYKPIFIADIVKLS